MANPELDHRPLPDRRGDGSQFPQQRRQPAKTRSIVIEGVTTNNLQERHARRFRWACSSASPASAARARVRWSTKRSPRRSFADWAASRRSRGRTRACAASSQIDKVIPIDQSPLGRSPRSNPATYTGVFDEIRKVFAATREAKQRGFKANRFSFNVAGGRCEECQGQG